MLALVAALKPVPALVLALVAWRGGGAARVLSAGLAFAALGDALLLRSDDTAFLAGMLAFAAMHVWYIVAFARTGSPWPRYAPYVVAAYLAALLGALAILVPHAGTFGVPLAVYSALLVTMAGSALRAGTAAAWGGALFLCSDTLLAFAKFMPSFPLAPALAQTIVLATYYAAQVLIVAGFSRARVTAS